MSIVHLECLLAAYRGREVFLPVSVSLCYWLLHILVRYSMNFRRALSLFSAQYVSHVSENTILFNSVYQLFLFPL